MSAETPTCRLTAPPSWLGLMGYGTERASWQRLVTQGRLPPVLLLAGRAGLGKRLLLSYLAALHFCQRGDGCGVCEPCLWLLSGSHPEVLWLESGDGKLALEEAALLQDHLALSPGSGARARVAVVVDADQLNVQAANRLLKTLEEPAPRAMILLSTSRGAAMLPTVLSRCVSWRLSPPPLDESAAWLEARLAAAGRPPLAPEELSLVLKRAGLAPGQALRLLGLAGDEADGDEEDPDLTPLLAATSVDHALGLADQIARQGGASLPQILEAWERALNQSYWRALQGQEPRPPLAALLRRRELLGRAKSLALRGRVALNAQLTVENLALAGRA